jgi:hypothetical protein
MRLQPLMASVLVALGVASCGEKAPPQDQPQSQTDLSASRSANQRAGAAHSSVSNHTAKLEAPVPPIGAQNTIMCDSVDGPGHIENATLLRSRLAQASGLSDWYVIHGEKDSTIYYGYYGSMQNPEEKKRADTDRARLAALTDRLGNRLIRGGVIVPVNSPDPEAPAAWNLLNTPKDAYWTIEIATFAQNAQRKEAAVQMVRELRNKGETDAYYFHGPTASSVCIGAWPRDAVAEQGTGIDKNGNSREDAHAQNPDQSLLVFGGPDVAPKNVSSRVLEPGTGKPMTVEGQALDIQSPDMKKKAADFPYHWVNYELHGSQGGGRTIPDPSVLVVIPRDLSGTGSDDYRLTGGAPSHISPEDMHRRAPSSPGDDVLRSFGDH